MRGKATLIEHNGERMSLNQLAKRSGVSHGALWARYRQGQRGEQLTRRADPKLARTDARRKF